MTHLFRCTQCAGGTLQNCPLLYCIQYMYFPIFLQILRFSSNRKAWNSAPLFQFVTQGQETHSKIHETHEIPAFPASKRNEIWTTPILFMTQDQWFGKIRAERHEFQHFPENALNDPTQKSTKFRTQRKYFSILSYNLCPIGYINSSYVNLAFFQNQLTHVLSNALNDPNYTNYTLYYPQTTQNKIILIFML